MATGINLRSSGKVARVTGRFTRTPSFREKENSHFFANKTIPHGILHIGSRPYWPDVTFTFIGRITSLNVWNYYLSEAEVVSIDRNCGQGLGNLFQWINLKEKVDGQVKVLEPSSCKYEAT